MPHTGKPSGACQQCKKSHAKVRDLLQALAFLSQVAVFMDVFCMLILVRSFLVRRSKASLRQMRQGQQNLFRLCSRTRSSLAKPEPICKSSS